VRLVFAGTPDVAALSLRALLGSRHEVVAVITRPDAERGRGRHVARSAVAEVAHEHGLLLLQPESARSPELLAELSALEPECCPVVAYGNLIPASVLAVPPRGWVNLHFSLLPAWRGAAPVQSSIRYGDDVTGATTFVLDEGMDTGPILGTMTERISPTDTSGDLLDRLARSGADLLVSTLNALEEGTLIPQPQPSEGVSYAPKISVDDARVRRTQPAVEIDRVIRACTPAPGAWSTVNDDRIKVGPVQLSEHSTSLAPGQVQIAKSEVLVGTATVPVRLGMVQATGKRPMPAEDWARGLRLSSDAVFV
jgi:methionyl-tRNA formyltransferase